MHNIFIFVPGYGQIVSSATFLTVCGLQQQLMSRGMGVAISTLSFPDIAELRGMATTIWYDAMPQSSHMLFIDSDMGFTPDLIVDMLMFDEPLVGAIYAQRKLPVSWAGSGTGAAATERRGNFMLVEGVGFGCTLIRRDCMQKMVETYPELIDDRLSLHPAGETLRQAGANRLFRHFEKLNIPERGIISEDLSFCIRWNQTGGKTWANISHRISHVGPHDFGQSYLEVVQQQQQVTTLPVTNGTPMDAQEVPGLVQEPALQAAE